MDETGFRTVVFNPTTAPNPSKAVTDVPIFNPADELIIFSAMLANVGAIGIIVLAKAEIKSFSINIFMGVALSTTLHV